MKTHILLIGAVLMVGFQSMANGTGDIGSGSVNTNEASCGAIGVRALAKLGIDGSRWYKECATQNGDWEKCDAVSETVQAQLDEGLSKLRIKATDLKRVSRTTSAEYKQAQALDARADEIEENFADAALTCMTRANRD